jgi:probable HAF family extracellular repeat protein
MGLSCGDDAPLGLGDRDLATSGKPSTGGPTVTAIMPNTAPQDTTLDVQVSGTGFDRGSRVDLALDGIVSGKVQTNSTRFVNKSTLVASITIAADADPDLYDVIVTTTKGKRGIGIELFEISYAMTSLGTLPGDDSSQAYEISESGQIVGGSGHAVPQFEERIFMWSGGVMQEVGPGAAIAASDNRRILSYEPASVWQEVGGAWVETLLPTLPGPRGSGAIEISPDGTMIVGGSGDFEPVLWRDMGGTWSIEILPAHGNDVNDDGIVVGDGVLVKENGSWTTYPLSPFPGGSNAMGSAINAVGDVAGYDEDASGVRRALVWRRTPTGWGAPEYLGTLGRGSGAAGINNAGQVVGSSEVHESHDGLFHQHAFVWSPFQGMVDLGSRDTDSSASDINDLGQIVGASRKAAGGNFSGDFVAVLWEIEP